MTVLLGAGASVDAGVPAATAMTAKIVDALNQRDAAWYWPDTAQALNYAVGALIAHDTARDARPDAGVDVERLFAAVQMLADRDNLEVAPFVAAWAPALDSFEPPQAFPGFFDKDFARAFESRDASQVLRLLKDAVRSMVGPKPGTVAFSRLQDAMTMALRRLVDVDPARVDYLAPLLNLPRGPLTVATLNYDRGVEELCVRADLACDTGIGSWSGGRDWAWDDAADVRLLKLHGSIDWCVAEEERTEGRLPEARIEITTDPAGDHRRPAVVFGQRGKLRADGPFLAMLRAFDDLLGASRSLLVVGYSFRDEHVNTAIGRWLNADRSREVTVVDPAFPTDRRGLTESFADTMRWALVPQVPYGAEPLPGRLRVINDTAAGSLADLLGAGPTLTPPAAKPAADGAGS